jgi:hypothetical protein
MDVMKLMPLFGTITEFVENKRPLKKPEAIKITRTVTRKQMAQRERFNRAAYYAWRQIRNESSRVHFEQVARAENLPMPIPQQ